MYEFSTGGVYDVDEDGKKISEYNTKRRTNRVIYPYHGGLDQEGMNNLKYLNYTTQCIW